MKVQFKYAFITALKDRRYVYAAVFGIMLAAVIPGALGLLPYPALVTAVSLVGIGIAVVFVFNIISDVYIAKRMFDAPDAYIYALIPVHRGKTLLANVIAMVVLDLASMALVITGEVFLGFMLSDISLSSIGGMPSGGAVFAVCIVIMFYLCIILLILFGSALSASVFYKKRAGGIWTFLCGIGIYYIFSLSQLMLAPFGEVTRHGIFISVYLDGYGMFAYIILLFAAACVLFTATSKLMERKINI